MSLYSHELKECESYFDPGVISRVSCFSPARAPGSFWVLIKILLFYTHRGPGAARFSPALAASVSVSSSVHC